VLFYVLFFANQTKFVNLEKNKVEAKKDIYFKCWVFGSIFWKKYINGKGAKFLGSQV
jgi:hypothetical protein